MANEINAVAGQLFGVPVGQVYTAGPGIKIDNVHKTVTFNPGTWEDVSSEASYNTNAINSGNFKIYYNSVLNLLSVSCDVNVKAGALNFFTWSDRLKPMAGAFALGGGTALYISSSTLYQASSATSRWVNGVWIWPVVGGN